MNIALIYGILLGLLLLFIMLFQTMSGVESMWRSCALLGDVFLKVGLLLANQCAVDCKIHVYCGKMLIYII